MSRGKPNSKVELIKLLRERPNLSAQEIADALGIHYRSVYRVIDTCMEDGYAIIHENKRFRLRNRDRDQAIIDFSLTGQQAHDLIVAAGSIKTLTPHAEEALSEISKHLVGSNLDQEAAVYYHSYDAIDTAIYRTIIAGIRTCKTLALTYLPTREGRDATQHLFEPYKVIFWNGHYYVVGRSRAYAHKPSGGVMHLRLDRIGEVGIATEAKTASESGAAYQQSLTFPKVAFDAREYVERVFGTFGGKREPVDIALHFPKSVAKAAAEVDRHPSKRLEWLSDGSLIYRLTVPLSQEIIWWAASWAGVRVLEPLELREQVHHHALEIARINSPEDATTENNNRLMEAR